MEELLPLMIVIFIIVALPLAFAWLCDRLNNLYEPLIVPFTR